jgi:predicted transcriptional regulator of viral defense system
MIKPCTYPYPAMTYLERIRYTRRVDRVTGTLPATFTFAEAEGHGLSRRALQRLQDTGVVERIARGLYRRTDDEPADYDLIEIAAKAHRPTLCLLSALARHELTDIIPSLHDVALPRGVWQPVVSAPVHWHKFDAETFDVGRTEIRLDSTYAIGLYDAPRSIIDAFRLRRAMGPEIPNEALRRWLRRGGKPADLMRLSRTFPAARPALLHTLQVLL